ncbi:O-antigen ligase family protein [Marinomonas balearica]|uniref:O-antigen ligase n=1 Tax=Marinomonas balearica TaxID=491947 RepID=A0A4R6M602_9GAMM|nr:O-antigen ligase family protein [Marinomonas balearica]TDO96000.1 O-antigen ligase [Marinomonas balearica]
MMWFDRGLWWLAGLSLMLSLVVPNGYSIGMAMLFLASLFAFFLKVTPSLTKQDRALFFVLVTYFLLMVLFVYLDGWHVRELDRPSRFLFVLPVMLLLLGRNGQRIALWVGVIIGAYGAFGVAVYERFLLNYDRAQGGEHSIMFGDTSMLLGLLSAVATLFFLSRRQFLFSILALFASIAGIMGSLLSGSRGGWVALPLIMFFILWQSRELLGKKLLSMICIAGIVSITAVLNIPNLNVSKRLYDAVHNVQAYIDGNPDSSVGLRFEMWKANLYLFTTAPVLGVGEYRGMELKKQLADEGKMARPAAQFSHAHNEYIDALGLRGIVGFLALMAVYLVPLRLFLAKMREYKDNWNVKAYAMAGALVPMSYMDFALTQSMFSHNIGVMMYVFPIVFFWAATRWAEREEKGEV